MCCAFTVLILLGPRVFAIFWWLFRPLAWNAVFNTIIWPILGIIFLPWTTLMYMIVYGPNGIIGIDWLWLALAVVADIATHGGGFFGNRDRVGM